MSRVLGLLCLEGGLDDPPGHLPETVSGDSDSKVVTVTCQLDIQRSQIYPSSIILLLKVSCFTVCMSDS